MKTPTFAQKRSACGDLEAAIDFFALITPIIPIHSDSDSRRAHSNTAP